MTLNHPLDGAPLTTLATLKQAAVDAAGRFASARDELVKAEAAYNAALHRSNPTTVRTVDTNRPLQFSNTVKTDC